MSLPRLFSQAALSVLGVVPLLCAGCAGYHFGPIKPEKMASVQTLAVPTFKNMTLEPRSSVLITNEVIGRLQLDGSYKVASTAAADAVLKGTIVELRRRPLRGARFNTLRTREMEFELFVDFTVEDARTKELLTEGRARGSSQLFLDENFQLTERQSLQEAASDVAREIVTRLAEGIPGQAAVGGSSRDLMGNRRSSGF
jgi:Lipopolysaccharide-assembly